MMAAAVPTTCEWCQGEGCAFCLPIDDQGTVPGVTPEELVAKIHRTGIPQDVARSVVLRLFNQWHVPTIAPTVDEWYTLAKDHGRPGEDTLLHEAMTWS